MNDTDRIIGELKEFKRVTITELYEIKRDVRSLQQFKWRVAGGATLLAFALTGVIEMIHLVKGN